MQNDTRERMLHWVDLIIERITKITHNRIAKITISGLICVACSMTFGLPLIKLYYEPSMSYTEAVIEFNKENPWSYAVAIICVVAVLIVFVVNRNADRESSVTSNSNASHIKIKGDHNIVIANSHNSKIIK